jgi:hypothetical protein
MSGNNFMVLTRNLANRSTFSGGSWEDEWPLGNVQTSGLREVARSQHPSLASTSIHVANGRRSQPYRMVALLGHNLTGNDPAISDVVGTPLWRIRSVFNNSVSGLPHARFKAYCPAATIAASSNLSGTVANVQDADPRFPDGQKLSAVSATTNTDARFTFDAGNVLIKSSGTHTFWLVLSRTGSSGINPTYSIDLYQAGAFRSTLVTSTSLSSPTGEFIAVSFSGSLLTGTPTADDVEVRIRGAASAVATVEIQSVMFRAEIQSGGNMLVEDSGWMAVASPPEDYFESPVRDVLYAEHLLSADIEWDEMSIEIDMEDRQNDPEYMDVGHVVIGGLSTFDAPEALATAPEYPFRFRPVDTAKNSRGKSGALITESGGGAIYREVSFRFPSLSMTTALETIAGRLNRLGVTGRAYWIFPWFSLWGVAKTLDDTSLEGGGHEIWSRGFTIEEAL